MKKDTSALTLVFAAGIRIIVFLMVCSPFYAAFQADSTINQIFLRVNKNGERLFRFPNWIQLTGIGIITIPADKLAILEKTFKY